MSMLLLGLHEVSRQIWLVLFAQVTDKHLRMNASKNLESLTEMPKHFGRAKCPHTKNIDI